MESYLGSDFIVTVTRDFNIQMVRENIKLHAYFLRVSDMWKKILILIHYL